jgi:hypothetical protein
MKTSEINFKIQLDENHLPESMQWSATDSDVNGIQDCKSLMISVWDPKEKSTLNFRKSDEGIFNLPLLI